MRKHWKIFAKWFLKLFNDAFFPGWGPIKFSKRLKWGYKIKGLKQMSIHKHLTIERK